MPQPQWTTIGELEVEVMGQGDAVVVIQTALTADELRPLAQQVAGRGGFQVVHLHRRGYAGSGAATGERSVGREVDDCRELLTALDLPPVHVVGASYSAAIALTLAATDPGVVRSLAIMEPPPVHVPSAPEFVAANARLVDTYRAHGPLAALDEIMTLLGGPDWRDESESALPGSVAAMERDAATFFEVDVPALLAWRFGAEEAAAVRCPVLHIGGTDSGPWFAEVRERVLRLLPQAEDRVVAGAGHLLAVTHTEEVAALVVDFLRRHPS